MEMRIVKVNSNSKLRRVKSQIFDFIVQIFLNYPCRDPLGSSVQGAIGDDGRSSALPFVAQRCGRPHTEPVPARRSAMRIFDTF